MKHIMLAVLLCLSSFSFAQTTNITRAVITWEANPPSENVGWYIVKWQQNPGQTVDEMPLITETNQTTYELNAEFFSPSNGDNICVVIIAAKGSERSVPSDAACSIYGLDTVVVAPEPTLSKPTTVMIIFR